jgi:hypothetical protein
MPVSGSTRSSTFDPVPSELDEILDPGWLTAALDDVRAGERVVTVEPLGTSKTLASKIRFRATIQSADGETRARDYCVKVHFAGTPETLLTEAHFYRELRPRLEVRAPRAWYTGIDEASERALIVMDDVLADGGRILGAHEPYPVERCRDALGQLAVLHAATWGDDRWDVEWLASRVSGITALLPEDYLQGLLDDGRAADLPAELRDGAALRAAMARHAELPITCVLHGDPHSGNAYVNGAGEMCWLDWQIVQRGHWSTDVSYHLGTVLSVDDRRAHEAGLLRHYLSVLRDNGVEPPEWDEAWERYTLGFTWGYFLWVITQVTAREIVLLHIPRLGAALTDHDTFSRLGVLPAPP